MKKERYNLAQMFDEITMIPICGIYVIAYMGTVLYVGKSVDIAPRMRTHCTVNHCKIDLWLQQMVFDYENIRIDILIPGLEVENIDRWLDRTELKCIRKFSPLFNDLLI